MAIARYRDQFITLANNVQAVKMEGASKLICQFFARVHEETYVFPVIKMNNASDACVEGDNFINLCTFCKLFPHCKQVKMNGDNFDWSLDGMIAFLSKYNLNYSRIALQDIYICFCRYFRIVLQDIYIVMVSNHILNCLQISHGSITSYANACIDHTICHV
eukprot:735806_1